MSGPAKSTLPYVCDGARLSVAPTYDSDDGATLVNETNSTNDETRSVSRGRDSFHSSGRGGIGNIRRSSISSDTRPFDNPEDSTSTRGRESAVHPDRAHMFSIGRGGAGNIRSPSQDVGKDHPQTATILNEHATVQAEYEQRIKKHHAESNPVHSSGRGGIGNISGSRSRSRGPTLAIHSTGRGGAGNIQYEAPAGVHMTDEEERRTLHAQAAHLPSTEHTHHHGTFESSGRGGSGNIRSRSVSRDPNGRAASRDPKEKHGIAALWSKVSHPSSPGSGDGEPRQE